MLKVSIGVALGLELELGQNLGWELE